MPSFTSKDLVVGRVVSEDGEYMLIELLKDDSGTFTLDAHPGNNQFYTLAFMKFEDGEAVVWKPWVAN